MWPPNGLFQGDLDEFRNLPLFLLQRNIYQEAAGHLFAIGRPRVTLANYRRIFA